MEQHVVEPLTELTKYGLAGIVILLLILAVRVLWLRYDKLQESRVEEGRKALEVINNNTHALNENTELLRSFQAGRRRK